MKMKRWLLLGVVVLNLSLIGALAVRYVHEPTAYAQARGRPAFLTITGHMNNKLVYYVLDANTGRLAALRLEPDTKRVVAISGADVGKDMDRVFKAR